MINIPQFCLFALFAWTVAAQNQNDNLQSNTFNIGGGNDNNNNNNGQNNHNGKQFKNEVSLANNNNNNNNNQGGNQNSGKNSDPKTSLCLDPSVIQDNSKSNGITDQSNPDHFAPSLTSTNNFINFCVGQTITDGKQIEQGSCNPTPIGSIPSKQNMPSVKMFVPTSRQKLQANQPIEIKIAVKNLDTGFFTSPSNTYFGAPQQLNSAGLIQGHIHVSVQQMGEDDDVPDTSKVVFFKGLSDTANNGILTTTIPQGLPDGKYRVATITSAMNHQPVVVPVAGRGSIEDM
ncbi:hypothetical protein DFH28DRAFT_894283 [Melampsora americana]|nr:hypothetical protein DFH28DRAFT_894283 [Melampsora americana]